MKLTGYAFTLNDYDGDTALQRHNNDLTYATAAYREYPSCYLLSGCPEAIGQTATRAREAAMFVLLEKDHDKP